MMTKINRHVPGNGMYGGHYDSGLSFLLESPPTDPLHEVPFIIHEAGDRKSNGMVTD